MNPNEPNKILQGIKDIIEVIYRTETQTPAGRNNAFFGLLLFVILLVLIIPDNIISILNTILDWLNGPLIPQLPTWSIIIFLFMVPTFMAWCVWYLNTCKPADI